MGSYGIWKVIYYFLFIKIWIIFFNVLKICFFRVGIFFSDINIFIYDDGIIFYFFFYYGRYFFLFILFRVIVFRDCSLFIN